MNTIFKITLTIQKKIFFARVIFKIVKITQTNELCSDLHFQRIFVALLLYREIKESPLIARNTRIAVVVNRLKIYVK